MSETMKEGYNPKLLVEALSIACDMSSVRATT